MDPAGRISTLLCNQCTSTLCNGTEARAAQVFVPRWRVQMAACDICPGSTRRPLWDQDPRCSRLKKQGRSSVTSRYRSREKKASNAPNSNLTGSNKLTRSRRHLFSNRSAKQVSTKKDAVEAPTIGTDTYCVGASGPRPSPPLGSFVISPTSPKFCSSSPLQCRLTNSMREKR